MDIMGKSLNDYWEVSKIPVIIMALIAFLGFVISLGNFVPFLNILTIILGGIIGLSGFGIALLAVTYTGFNAAKSKFELTNTAIAGAFAGTLNAIVVGILSVVTAALSMLFGISGGALSGDLGGAALGGIGGGIGIFGALVGTVFGIFFWIVVGGVLGAVGGFLGGAGSGKK